MIGRTSGFQTTQQPDVFALIAGKLSAYLKPQQLAELHVVPQLRMHVQRQVISKQANLIFQQGLNPGPLDARNGWVLTFPEIAVMDQQHIRVLGDRPVY